MYICLTRQMHFAHRGGGQEGVMESWTEAKVVRRACSYAGRYCTSARKSTFLLRYPERIVYYVSLPPNNR